MLVAATFRPVLGGDLEFDRLDHFTSRDGLSQDWVIHISQDRQGFLWIGTDDGLNRYDGYRFRGYRHDPDDPSSLSHNFIICTFADRSGHLWVGTQQGLNRLNRTTESFDRFLHDPARPDTLRDDFITAIHEDRRGSLWVGTMLGLDRFDRETESFHHVTLEPEAPDEPSPGLVRILESRSGELWITRESHLYRYDGDAQRFERFASFRIDEGSQEELWTLAEGVRGQLWLGATNGDLYAVDPGSGQQTRYPLSASGINIARALLPRPDGRLWIGTDDHGVLIFEPESGTWTARSHDPGDPGSLSEDRIMSIFEDRTGVLWFGTEAGLDKLDPARTRFSYLRHRPGDPDSLSADWISAVMEDSRGDLWVGSGGHGLNRLDRETGRNTRYRYDPSDPGSLGNNQVLALLEDRNGIYWAGTHAGIERFDPRTGSFTRLGPDSGWRGELPDGWIYDLVESEPGVLWAGSDGGLHRLDTRTLQAWHYENDSADPADPEISFVYALTVDQRGDLWVGTDDSGLFRLELSATDGSPAEVALGVWHFGHDVDDPSSLGSNDVNSIFEDRTGTLWLGTLGAGLYRLDDRGPEGTGDPADFTFTPFREKDGLANDYVLEILEDGDGNLWMSGHRGLTRFDPRTETFKNFGLEDGLQGTSFVLGAAAKRADGELLFGGTAGLNGFFPEHLVDDPHVPQVAITDFRLFNRSLPFSARSSSAGDGELSLTLSHRDRIVAFEFAALHFAKPGKNRYAQQLEGFSDEWIETDARDRLAQYTDLDAGDYVFRVRAANADGLWSEDGAAVRIQVLPPPWKTWWAYSLYGLALVLIVAGFVRSQQRKVEQERQIAERERRVSRRLREVDKLKDDFLANTSHELRTPLYGITGLAESLLDGATGDLPTETKANLAMIVSSGRRLGRLVNDILDFSKLRHKSLELSPGPVDLRSLTEVVLTLSRPLVGAKDLQLANAVPADLPAAEADEDRLQQILYNLVGNAIKFTESGTVEISAAVKDSMHEVRVADTGIGIAPERQTAIFDAFEQADASVEREHGGTGLGLAVTRQLVELHGGALGVESVPGEGSVFSFTLPVSREAAAATKGPSPLAVEPPQTSETELLSVTEPDGSGESPDGPRILVVDDEPVNLQVLVHQLASEGYRVTCAASGPEALQLVEGRPPDLALLDVMMPRMSGYEVCRALRERYSLEQLPVIFLTAKRQPEDLVVGLAAGANDYLPKPISKAELLARVKTHLDLLGVHRRLSELFDERTSQLGEREQLLAERARLIEDLETRNAELARFNYSIAHDLKNPLTTIKNFVGLVARDAEAGDQERLSEDLERVDKAADRLMRLLDELYELSRIERPREPYGDVPLAELVSEVFDELAGAIARTGVHLEVASELPVVRGDRAQLAQMFRHLLSNAVRFLGDSPQPRIEIGVEERPLGPVVTVRDNGIGIDPRYHERVFGLFERLESQASDGTGVGLALVKRIVEVHGGEVWVESEGLGKGSTFFVSLPVASHI